MLHSQQFFHWFYKDKFQKTPEKSLSQWVTNETTGTSVLCQLLRSTNMNSLTLDIMETMHSILSTCEKTFILTGDRMGVSVGDDALWMYSNPRSIGRYCALKARCEMRLKEIWSVCVMRGNCLGSGAGLSLACGFRIATASSVFGLPENSLGGTPDCAALHFLSNYCGGLGLYLALTGCSLRGADLFFKGIATHFIPEENVDRFIEEAKNSNDMRGICEKYHVNPLSSLSKIQKNIEEIEEVFAKVAGIEELYEKLAGKETEFRKSVLHLLAQQCPISLKVWGM